MHCSGFVIVSLFINTIQFVFFTFANTQFEIDNWTFSAWVNIGNCESDNQI